MTDHSRADLLRFKKVGIDLEGLATSVWFKKLPIIESKQPVKGKVIDVGSLLASTTSTVKAQAEVIKQDETDTPRPPEYFWALTEKSTKEPPVLTGEDIPEDLAGLISSAPLSEKEDIYAEITRPDKKVLLAWERLWPALQSALSQPINNRRIDTDKLVRQVAQGQWPNKIPVKTKQHLAAQALVLVHIPDYLHPLRRDIHTLLDKLEQYRGGQGLTLQYVQDYPGGSVSERRNQKRKQGGDNNNWTTKPWHLPEQGTPILIISDLGLYSHSSYALQRWLKLGRQLKAAGFSPTVLTPVPDKWLPKELTSVYQCLSWDQGSTLNPVKGRFNIDQVKEKVVSARKALGCNPILSQHQAEEATKIDRSVRNILSSVETSTEDQARKDYLMWLSAAVEMDENDLRAVRLALGKPLSVADEVLLWQSSLIESSPNLCAYTPEIHETLRDRLQKLITLQPNNARKVFRALLPTLQTQLAIDYYEALLFFKYLSGLTQDEQQLLTKAEKYTNGFIQTLAVSQITDRHDEYEGIHDYSQQVLDRLGQKAKEKDRRYSYWWSQWYKNHMGDRDKVAMPEWVDPSIFQAVNNQGSTEYNIEIAIQGSDLVLSEGGAYQTQLRQGLDNQWEPIDQIETNYDQVIYSLSGRNKSQQEHLTLSSGFYKHFPLSRLKEQEYQFQIGDKNFGLASFKRPSWASSIQNVGADVSSCVYLNGEKHIVQYNHQFNLEIVVQDKEASSVTQKAHWRFINDISDGALVKEISEDQYGLYADLNFFGVIQRFRWIEPGTFLMGSPEDEPERNDDEQQHSVTLTQGYWLADTCTTQELWQAIMGGNPSDFKGEQNPVDTVSWQDCWQFIQKLKEKYTALRVTLPSEAQWEYACRASTTMPFSFGDQIHPDQVNFDGNYPYGESEKSVYREKTVPVKSLSANPWGLFEMNGNLWEWCQDEGLRDYDQSITDPGLQWLESPEGNKELVRSLRGGSWNLPGLFSRSAYRFASPINYRKSYLGFRLSLCFEPLGEGEKRPRSSSKDRDSLYEHLFNITAGLKE